MSHIEARKAVVLLSGGLDSTTCLAIARHEGYDLFALSFNYQQRHKVEIEAARTVAREFEVKEHLVLDLPLGRIGGSALTAPLDVPKDVPLETMPDRIPVTYVPARNTIFLSFALGWAEVLGAEDIFIGVNALDYSGYPDCRPEFIRAFERMSNLATREGVEGRLETTIHTPLIAMTKKEIIQKGIELGVDYAMTKSCYDPGADGLACGHCESCLLRRKGFDAAGLDDPTGYVPEAP